MNISKQIEGNPSNAIGALVLFIVIGWFSAGLLFAALSALIPAWGAIFLGQKPQSAEFLRSMVAINLPVMFLLPALHVAGKYRPGHLFRLSQTHQLPTLGFALLSIVAIVICQPGLSLIGEWNKGLVLPDALNGLMQWIRSSEAEAESMSNLMLQTHSFGVMLLNVVVVGILPGFCEEFLFRGVVQPVMTDWLKKKHTAIWVTAFIFSLIHFQFLGFFPRLLLGAGLGYLVSYSGSLWSSVLAHSLNNSLIVVLTYLQFNGVVGHEIDSLGFGKTLWIGILSILLTTALFVVIGKRKKE